MTENRYYLVELPRSHNPARLDAVLAKMQRQAGKRERACEIGHYRLSLDGSLAIVQANLDPTEHNWLIKQPWVQELGRYNPATGHPEDPDALWARLSRSQWEVE